MYIFYIILIFVYFIPSIVSLSKGLLSSKNIILINLFLGWTYFYWIESLTLAIILEKNEEMSFKYMIKLLYYIKLK